MKLRKATEMYRATVQREACVVVHPEAGAGAGKFRRVTLLAPQTPATMAGIDKTSLEVGPDRTYKLSLLPTNFPTRFNIGPGQCVIAASEIANSYLSVIVEYYEES